MPVEIKKLKPEDRRDTSDGIIVSRTPSGKWQVDGPTEPGDKTGMAFAVDQAFAEYSHALARAGDMAENSGLGLIYVKGHPDA
jgi:hypothetical protein